VAAKLLLEAYTVQPPTAKCLRILPKRVINVGELNNSRSIRLRRSQAIGRQVIYTTLSHRVDRNLRLYIVLISAANRTGLFGANWWSAHCWDGANAPKLANSTLDSMHQGISFEDLPLTFRDAIETTRWLGFQYLWIDALCIVQDSDEEWREESGKMGDGFSNSDLTIGALSSHDSYGGVSGAVIRFVSGLAK